MQKCPPNEGSSLLTPHFTSRLFVFQEFISIYTCPLLFLLATNPFNRPSIPKHLSDRDLRCGRKPDVHRVGNLKLINLDQRLPFSVTGNHMESLVLLVIVVYSEILSSFEELVRGWMLILCCQLKFSLHEKLWFPCGTTMFGNVSWHFFPMNFYDVFPFRHDSGPTLEAQYRWEGQGRRRLPGTDLPQMFLRNSSRPQFPRGPSVLVPCPRSMTLLSLRSCGKVAFWLLHWKGGSSK